MSQPPGSVSVLVPTIGREGLLERCLRSVLACDPPPAELVVVDQSHGAGDVAGLLAALGSDHGTTVPTLRHVPCDGRGTARAMNVGLAAVTHDTVLVTHDDCTVAVDWVGVGARLAAGSPGAILTGRVLPPEGAGNVPSTKTDPRPRDFTGQVTTGVLYPACMVVSSRAIQEIGGFDERRSLLVAEDNDLCYRWLVDGRVLRYEPEMVVWHHDWRTPEQLVRTHIAYAKAQGGFYAKHLRAGDRRILRLLRWDLKHAVRTTVRGLVRREPRWTDPYREMIVWLLVGLVEGWRDDRAVARRQAAGRG